MSHEAHATLDVAQATFAALTAALAADAADPKAPSSLSRFRETQRGLVIPLLMAADGLVSATRSLVDDLEARVAVLEATTHDHGGA